MYGIHWARCVTATNMPQRTFSVFEIIVIVGYDNDFIRIYEIEPDVESLCVSIFH